MIKKFILFSLVFSFPVLGNFLIDGVLVPSKQLNSCISYISNTGLVKDGEDLSINSDKFQITDDKKLILYGNVELDFFDGLLRSKNAEVDRENGKVQFSNQGEIFLKTYYFNAEDGYLNKDNNSLLLNKGLVFSKQRNLVFNFDNLLGTIDDEIRLQNATMSSCADPAKGWLLEAKEIILDSKTNRGVAKNIKIKAAGSTIFKFPYIPFATTNERMSGFLEPSISFSSDGADLMIPYYKVISNKSDLTFAPRYIAKRGPGFEFNYRSLHGDAKNLRNIDLIFFTKDDEFKDELKTKDDSRWIYKYEDAYSFNNLYLNIDWSKSSDPLTLRDIPGDITSIGYERIQNLNQNISFSKKFKNTLLKIEHQAYQSLNPILSNGYTKTPAIDIRFKKNLNGYVLTEHLNVSTFKASSIHGFNGYQSMHQNLLTRINNPTEGTRIFSDLSISKNMHINGINVSSKFGIKIIDYDLSSFSKAPKNVTVPNAMIDLSSLYVKKVNKKLHLLEPRLVIGYTGYKDQSTNPVFDSEEISPNNELFNNIRFSGMDRIGDQNFYTLSLKYRKKQMGMDKISLSISKKYYLKDRKVWLNQPMSSQMPSMGMMNMMGMMDMMDMDEGPVVLMGKWMPSMKTMIMGYSGYLQHNNKVPLGGITIKQKVEKGSIGYAHRYRRMSGDFNHEMQYSEFFADLNINPNYKLIVNFKRDHTSNKNIESLFGLEYENCCLALRVTTSDRDFSKFIINEEIMYHHLSDAWDNIIKIENKSRINFEFELKGLNSSFNKVNKFLNNSLFYN